MSCIITRGATDIEFRVRTNSCPNSNELEWTRTNVLARFRSLRNVVEDKRCVAHKLRLHSSKDKHFKQLKEQILQWQTRSIPSSGSLSPTFFIFLSYSLKWLHHLVCSMLCVDLCYCARVHVLSIHCTVMDPIPKHARRTQSWVQRSRMLSNCVSPAAQDVGSRNHTVMYNHVHVHDCTCTTYTSQFELEYESTFLFLNEYLNFRSFHPKFSHTGF